MTSRSEHTEQVALFRWAALAKSRWPELMLLHAIPNGGHRHIQVARRLKAEGVKAGVPDLCLPVARGGWHGLYIELKTATGRLSAEQGEWLTALETQGYRVAVCRGWQGAWRVIEEYLGGRSGLVRSRLQFDVYDTKEENAGALSVVAITNAIRQALDGFRGTVSGVSIRSLAVEGDQDRTEAISRLAQRQFDMIIWHDED